MGFLDKAKAAANDLAAKADTALGSSGMGGPKAPGGAEADTYFRDLGVLAYLEAKGRPSDPDEHLRVMTALQEMDTRGAIPSFALHTAPPPPPGTAAAGSQSGFPPQPGAAGSPAPPPPPGGATPQQQAPAASPSTPPPPPPSWMNKDGSDKG
jgi:hypothetical protein